MDEVDQRHLRQLVLARSRGGGGRAVAPHEALLQVEDTEDLVRHLEEHGQVLVGKLPGPDTRPTSDGERRALGSPRTPETRRSEARRSEARRSVDTLSAGRRSVAIATIDATGTAGCAVTAACAGAVRRRPCAVSRALSLNPSRPGSGRAPGAGHPVGYRRGAGDLLRAGPPTVAPGAWIRDEGRKSSWSDPFRCRGPARRPNFPVRSPASGGANSRLRSARAGGQSVGEPQTAGVGPDLLDGFGRVGILGHEGQEPLRDELDEDARRPRRSASRRGRWHHRYGSCDPLSPRSGPRAEAGSATGSACGT